MKETNIVYRTTKRQKLGTIAKMQTNRKQVNEKEKKKERKKEKKERKKWCEKRNVLLN